MAIYYRIALVVPLLLGLIGTVVQGPGIGEIFETAMVLMLLAGIPYLCFVLCAFIWSFRHPAAEHWRAFLFSPLIFGLFHFVISFIRFGFITSSSSTIVAALSSALFFAIFAILISGIFSWTALGLWYLFGFLRSSK